MEHEAPERDAPVDADPYLLSLQHEELHLRSQIREVQVQLKRVDCKRKLEVKKERVEEVKEERVEEVKEEVKQEQVEGVEEVFPKLKKARVQGGPAPPSWPPPAAANPEISEFQKLFHS